VVPRRVRHQSPSSSPLPSAVGDRRKRSSGDALGDEDASSPAVYDLSAFGRRWSLRLRSTAASELISPSFVVQHVADNETWLASPHLPDRWRCFHEGQVDDDPHSIVVMSTCSHLV